MHLTQKIVKMEDSSSLRDQYGENEPEESVHDDDAATKDELTLRGNSNVINRENMRESQEVAQQPKERRQPAEEPKYAEQLKDPEPQLELEADKAQPKDLEPQHEPKEDVEQPKEPEPQREPENKAVEQPKDPEPQHQPEEPAVQQTPIQQQTPPEIEKHDEIQEPKQNQQPPQLQVPAQGQTQEEPAKEIPAKEQPAQNAIPDLSIPLKEEENTLHVTHELMLWLKADDGIQLLNPEACVNKPEHCHVRLWSDLSMHGTAYNFMPPKMEKHEDFPLLRHNAINKKPAVAFTCPMISEGLHLHDFMTLMFVIAPEKLEVRPIMYENLSLMITLL